MKTFSLWCALLCPSLLFIANSQAADSLSYTIIAERSHKPSHFTQGLLVDKGHFYESTGLYGKSLLVSYPVVEPDSTWAKIAAPYSHKQKLPERFFAEGLALLNNHLYQLTWQEKSVLLYNKDTLAYEKSLNYEGQGWGLTSDGKSLIRSDGSDTLSFHDPENFAVTKTLKVHDGDTAISNLNELEYVQGFVWANIWYDNRIIKIDPHTGLVVAQVDLSQLVRDLQLKDTESVLNGIAWDEQQQALWVTGKLWPKMFLIKTQ